MTVHQPSPVVPDQEDSLTGASSFMTVHQPSPAVPDQDDSLTSASFVTVPEAEKALTGAEFDAETIFIGWYEGFLVGIRVVWYNSSIETYCSVRDTK